MAKIAPRASCLKSPDRRFNSLVYLCMGERDNVRVWFWRTNNIAVLINARFGNPLGTAVDQLNRAWQYISLPSSVLTERHIDIWRRQSRCSRSDKMTISGAKTAMSLWMWRSTRSRLEKLSTLHYPLERSFRSTVSFSGLILHRQACRSGLIESLGQSRWIDVLDLRFSFLNQYLELGRGSP